MRHLLPHLTLALAASVATAAVAAPGLKPDFFAVHRSEPFLLHRQFEAAELRQLRVWDGHLATWRPAGPTEAPSERAQVLILHLWADWCVPCREELPLIRQLAEESARLYGDRAQVVLVSETSSPEAMRAFLEKQRERMPRGPLYLDTGEALARALRADLGTSLSYPVTLVLDGRRVVRHAIVGSIAGRRAELAMATSRLLRLPNPTPRPPAQ